ncbi:hypothetical protein GCM10010954_12220 [Halobacillus andaensis]|uniref:Uncharacterized protein n=1 Tax=Halobacillus andaensis TaxID=1176239 RepID=A0A917B108_HALAA|nr:hypothetical protein [Halobacillus andaensis]MBP2004019.1 hypothetical protein [Halobacillus andaensis]GGF15158.1 hypothetical protein GCM10010954_12220 [Halobacillus andaensis]
MWINILIGLVLPGAIIGYLFKKNPVVITLMYPVGVTFAVIFNFGGFGLFWDVSPTYEHNPSLSALPFIIGYFPLWSCLFGFIKIKEIVNPFLLTLLFTIITTILELWAVWLGKILYLNGWNFFWTFVIYLAGFIGVIFYIKLLKKYKILRQDFVDHNCI